MLQLTDKNFKEEVLKSHIPVVVDFWAPWCGPCKAIGPIVEELAHEYAGRVKIAKINIDENQAIPSAYGIMSIPTLLLFKGGQVIEQIVGVLNKSQLKKKIDANL